MSRMNDFIAFRALIELIRDNKLEHKIDEVYQFCKEDEKLQTAEPENHVKKLYALFTVEQISTKISEIVRPKQIFADVQVIFQTVENLHIACPKNTGDWYFTGDYPTAGGMRVANKALMNYVEGHNERAY